MTLADIIERLNLTVLTTPKDFSAIEPTAGYTSDLLSCVMTGAARQGLWVTLQAHANIVAVAALLDLAAVIITEAAAPEEATIDRANQEGITLLSASLPTFEIVGRLWEAGIRSAQE